MNNKKEKTFSDLFVDSTEQKNDFVDGNSSFGDIFKNSMIQDESFEREFSDKSNIGDTSDVESSYTFSSIAANSSDDNDSVNSDGENNTFNASNDTLIVKEDKQVDDGVKHEESNTLEMNDDSQANISLEHNVSSDIFFGHDDSYIIQDSNHKGVENEQVGSLDNPFFSFDNSTNNDKSISSELMNESVSDNSTYNDVEKLDLNVFFDSNKEISDDVKKDVVNSGKEEKDVSDTKSVKKDKDISHDKIEKKSASESPFFSNDSSDANTENPLFLNKLNLIESEKKDKRVDLLDLDKSRHFNVKIVKKKEPLFKVIIGVLSYAIFIWLLFIGITLLIYVLDIKIRAQKGDYSAPTFNAYVVLTGSMLPEIQVYDVVVTKKIKAADLKEGDVITFSSADTRFLNTIITHRIIKKNYDATTKGYTFQTKGDNNNVADSALVPQNNIYGKVILKIPKLGYLQEFLASRGGWIIVILIPCLTVISFDIVKLIKGLQRKKYKNIKVQK